MLEENENKKVSYEQYKFRTPSQPPVQADLFQAINTTYSFNHKLLEHIAHLESSKTHPLISKNQQNEPTIPSTRNVEITADITKQNKRKRGGR